MRLTRLTVLVVLVLLVLACSKAAKEPAPTPAGDASTTSKPSSSSDDDDHGSGATATGPTLFPLGPLPPDAPFEGRVTIQVQATDEQGVEAPDPALYYFTVKGKKARWDLFSKAGMGGPSGYRIYDGNQHKFFTVMRQPVLYTTDEAVLTGDAGAPKALNFAPYKLEPKGRVQDMACDHVEATDDAFEYSTCLTSELPSIPLHLLGGAVARAVPFGAQLAKKGVFPLSVIIRERKTPDSGPVRPVLTRLTTMKIERGLVPDKVFELPSFPVTETPGLIAPGLVR